MAPGSVGKQFYFQIPPLSIHHSCTGRLLLNKCLIMVKKTLCIVTFQHWQSENDVTKGIST